MIHLESLHMKYPRINITFKKRFICLTCLMAVFLLPFHAFSREAEATEVAEDGHKPTYMGSVGGSVPRALYRPYGSVGVYFAWRLFSSCESLYRHQP